MSIFDPDMREDRWENVDFDDDVFGNMEGVYVADEYYFGDEWDDNPFDTREGEDFFPEEYDYDRD